MIKFRFWFHSSVSFGAGVKEAYAVARDEASGRRAHQMCSVEMCPRRIFFSWADSAETSLTGKLSSINLFT